MINNMKHITQIKNAYNNSVFNKKRMLIAITIYIVITISLGSIYLIYEWNRYKDEVSAEAFSLAQSLEVIMPEKQISVLSGNNEDLNKPEYNTIKQKLMELVKTNNPIYFAYILSQRDDEIIILIDSESTDSPNYSPPGQVFVEADDIFFKPFRSGETVLTKPTTDRWGTWISVLVPIKDITSDEIIAVFGIDYSASEWYVHLWHHIAFDIIIVICIIVLFTALLFARDQYHVITSLNKQLAHDEALYRNIFNQAPIGIAIINGMNFINKSVYGNMNINPMYEKILGRSSDDLLDIEWPEITHPLDLENDLKKFEQFKNGENNGYSMEKRFIKPDGSVVWVNMIVSPLIDVLENNNIHLCIVEDITARKEMEKLLQESERKMAVLLSHIPGLAYRCNYDHNWTMQYVSDGCYELTGYHSDSLLYNRDLSYNDLISQEYREVLWNEWERVLALKQQFKYEYEITTTTGEQKWVIELGQGIYNGNGEVEALEGIVLDISDRKAMENNLRYINEHDKSTGLYNRGYLELLLEKDLKKQDGVKRALVGINLSTVQLLTSNYGFHYTQNLIKKAAETLSQYCTDYRLLFQTYVNRFVFYLINYKDKSELEDFSKTISNTLEILFVMEKMGGRIDVLEIVPGDNEVNADILLKRLLITSERAINLIEKDFSICFYDTDLEILINRENKIKQILSSISLDDTCGELFLQYQPILSLKGNSICAFEALARLRTEELGIVSPIEFIPIAEKTKLIIPIGEKIIRTALRFIKRLNECGYNDITVSINISTIQLYKPDFMSSLFEMINEMQVNPKNIGIEITETMFVSDYEFINNSINKLRDAGIHIAIDDFGTGYSSLAREKELNVNCLKIDKYFIDKLLEVGPDKAITSDIISMAHKLGHCAIAEGVELEEQKHYLLSHGCDRIQGFLISLPLNDDAAIELLNKQDKLGISCQLNDGKC